MKDIVSNPVYIQLKNIIAEKIETGQYPLGGCLPSERELEKLYHVSRVTVRKAMELLVDGGYISKNEKSRATVLAVSKHQGHLYAFVSDHPLQSISEIYGKFFSVLANRCNLNGDVLHYLDLSVPIHASLKNIVFDGFFLCCLTPEIKKKLSVFKNNPPMIILDACDKLPPMSMMVKIDARAGGQVGAEFLISRGYKKIVFLGVKSAYGYLPFMERRDACVEKCRELGVECQVVDVPKHLTEFIDEAVSQLVKDNSFPFAIFALNDSIAISILRTLHRLAIRVPDDIAVLGFDGLLVGELVFPSLTTVKHPATQIADTAFAAMTNGLEAGKVQLINPRIVIRETVGNLV